MTIQLNHTIVSARDNEKAALFTVEMLGLPAPTMLGPFAVVQIGDVSLDFLEVGGEITPQHYAFLVSETEFDAIFARIEARQLPFWADPHRSRQGRINHWDDGRGVYWDNPDGHLLEIITRPYGSAGTSAECPHPLVAPRIEDTANDTGGTPNDAGAAGAECPEDVDS